VSKILFATYEFHPTTWGGCGVLLRHATDLLLSQGHEVVLLLDIPKDYFDRFVDRDHPTLADPKRCTAYHADSLCENFPSDIAEVASPFIWKSLRFAHALRVLAETDPVDFVEFFEYCGVGYHSFAEKRFGLQPERPILGSRVHNSVELIDLHEGTKEIDRDRCILYGLERAALAHSESVLLPSQSYAERYYLERYGLSDDVIEISEPPTVRFEKRDERPIDQRREVQFFGRIFEFKGVECFVRAALLLLEEDPALDLDFVLIGNDSHDGPDGGSYSAYLKGTIPERFSDRFVFTGHIDHEAVVDRFGRARFVVFPNKFESFCYAAHEAYEAAVPMIVSDIPAFRNYLQEGRDAVYFDGTSIDLARQMRSLIDNPDQAEALDRGTRLATAPLGSFYEAPRAFRPIVQGEVGPLEVAIVVIVPPNATDAHLHRTLDAIQPQIEVGDEIMVAFEASDDRANTAATGVRWLGATRRVQAIDGAPISLGGLRTKDAMWIVLAGDEPQSDFLSLCRGALARNPSLGFAGTWHRDATGVLLEGTLDVIPERRPFEQGAQLTRALIRTIRDSLFVEVFDAQAGLYGEIGALWRAEETFGRGCLLPRAKLHLSSVDECPRNDGQLAFLVQSTASTARRERLSLLALEQSSRSTSTASDTHRSMPMDAEHAANIAHGYLDGTTLGRMALRKLARKLAAKFGLRAG